MRRKHINTIHRQQADETYPFFLDVTPRQCVIFPGFTRQRCGLIFKGGNVRFLVGHKRVFIVTNELQMVNYYNISSI